MILLNFFSKDTLIVSPSISLRQWKGFSVRKPEGMSNIIPLTDFTLKIFQGLRLWNAVSLLWWPFQTQWHETHTFSDIAVVYVLNMPKKINAQNHFFFFFLEGGKKGNPLAHMWYKKNLLEIKNN